MILHTDWEGGVDVYFSVYDGPGRPRVELADDEVGQIAAHVNAASLLASYVRRNAKFVPQ